MLGKKRWISLLLVISVSAGVGLAAAADSGTENEFLSLINSTRANSGLGPLEVNGGLQSHARNHTQDMIAAGKIYHSSNGELSAAGGSGWTRIGENVGRGQSPSSLHSAFMDSSGHKANILGDYNYVGIGTDSADGYLYVTVVFMKKGETAPPTTEAPPTTDAPAPPPPSDTPSTTIASGTGDADQTPVSSTTTTTVPPTTTTTLIVPPDKAVTPGQSCIAADRWSQLCHD
jgi:hypothetical protein